MEHTGKWLAELKQRYNRKRKWLTTAVISMQIALLVLLIGLWEVAGTRKWIDPLLFSYPSKLLAQLSLTLGDGTLWPHIGATVGETVVGFILGTIFGILLAALLWWFPMVSRVSDPYLVVLNSMPKVALGPLFIVSFGPGFWSIVAVTLSVTVIITTLNIYNRFQETEEGYLKVVRLLGASRLQMFTKVIVPASFQTMIATLKVNVGLAWVGVIVGEFLTAQVGLGYLIIYGFQVFNFTLVLSSLVVIAVVATAMYQAVSFIERKLTGSWRQG